MVLSGNLCKMNGLNLRSYLLGTFRGGTLKYNLSLLRSSSIYFAFAGTVPVVLIFGSLTYLEVYCQFHSLHHPERMALKRVVFCDVTSNEEEWRMRSMNMVIPHRKKVPPYEIAFFVFTRAMDLPGVEDLCDTEIPLVTEAPKVVAVTRAGTLNDRLQELEMLKNKGRGKAKVALNEEITREKEGVKGMFC